MCGHVLAMAYMWRSEANGSRDRTQVLRLDSKYPHPVNHLSGPQPFCPPQKRNPLYKRKRQNNTWLSSGGHLNVCFSRSNHHFLTVLAIKGPLNGTQIPGQSYHRNDADKETRN